MSLNFVARFTAFTQLHKKKIKRQQFLWCSAALQCGILFIICIHVTPCLLLCLTTVKLLQLQVPLINCPSIWHCSMSPSQLIYFYVLELIWNCIVSQLTLSYGPVLPLAHLWSHEVPATPFWLSSAHCLHV